MSINYNHVNQTIARTLAFTKSELPNYDTWHLDKTKPKGDPVPFEDMALLPATAQQMIKGFGVQMFTQNTMPHSDMSKDHLRIYLPKQAQFDNYSEFVSCVFHELTHCAGQKVSPVDDNTYWIRPIEEMIAELGCTYLLEEFKVPYNKEKRAGYIDGWSRPLVPLQAVALLTAMDEAKKRTDYLLKFVP